MVGKFGGQETSYLLRVSGNLLQRIFRKLACDHGKPVTMGSLCRAEYRVRTDPGTSLKILKLKC